MSHSPPSMGYVGSVSSPGGVWARNCKFGAFWELNIASKQCYGIKPCVVFIEYNNFMSIPRCKVPL